MKICIGALFTKIDIRARSLRLCKIVFLQATSPDDESIVTGAGDETLRFWSIFNKSPASQKSASVLNLFNHIR